MIKRLTMKCKYFFFLLLFSFSVFRHPLLVISFFSLSGLSFFFPLFYPQRLTSVLNMFLISIYYLGSINKKLSSCLTDFGCSENEGLNEFIKKGKFMTKIFFSDNVEWSSCRNCKELLVEVVKIDICWCKS